MEPNRSEEAEINNSRSLALVADEEMGQHSSSRTNDARNDSNIANTAENTMDVEAEENFDTTLPSAHSYLPGGLEAVTGRTVVEPGWEGKLPCWRHHSIIFPGENLPMLCNLLQDCTAMHSVIRGNKLFGLIWCADEEVTNRTYGVLCEVYEASSRVLAENIGSFTGLSIKAKARQRFRIVGKPQLCPALPRLMHCKVKVLPDVVNCDPLLLSGPRSLDKHRSNDNYRSATSIRRADAAFTAWPLSVYETLNVHKMTEAIKDHYKQFGFDKLPLDVVSLSFWVAANLSLAYNEQHLLFTLDNAVLRMFMELRHIIKFQKESQLCCTSCMAVITNRQNIFAMSSEGLHSNYCNPGGFVHDTLTVSEVSNVVLEGNPTAEFSWFPGYKWTIAQCRSCGNHLGWRFDAAKRNLRPVSFWGLSQHYLTTRHSTNGSEDDIYNL